MCGIVGAAGILNKREKEAIYYLMFLNSLRGEDGCGIISTFEENKGSWWQTDKSELTSTEYVQTEGFKSLVINKNLTGFIGHSRAATKGVVKIENNHPFTIGDIVGVHNGTIHGKFDNSHKYDTDSEALYHNIEEKGLKAALETVDRQSFSMAYALAFYSAKDHSISLIRNKERPLFLAKTDNGNYFWASEGIMLQFAMQRAGILPVDGYKPLVVDSLYKIFLDREGKERLKVIPNYIAERKTYTQGSSYGNSWWDGQRAMTYHQQANLGKKDKFVANEKDYTYYKIGQVYLNENYINNTMERCGCSNCKKSPKDIESVRFTLGGNKFVCEDCKDFAEDLVGASWDKLYKAEPLVKKEH